VGARLCTGLLAVAVAIATVGLAVANGEERAPRQFLGAWATQFARVADLLRDPPAWKASREQALEALRAHYDLPRVRARVGRETIDVFHYEQGAVLLNGLRWQPRPVPSYATYTPDLLRLNAAFFESDAAPRFVLYRHQTLDDRVPMLDDAAAIQVVLRRYAPVLTERSYLLLERRTEPSADPGPAVVFERAVRLGETVDLRGWRSETLILELEAHYTVRGRIRRGWLRAPPLFLEVEPKRGPRRRMRLVPSMASEGFVVSPWLPSHAAFTNWRSGHETLSIRSFRFMAPGQGFFEPELRVIVRSDPRLAPDATPDLVRFPMLEPQPEHVVAAGPVRFAQVDRGVGLILPAPGELRFRLPAGAFALEASYGVLAAADRATGASAGFRVERVDSLGSHTTLFQRALDPGANPAHRGSHVLRLRVEVDEGGELVMRSEAHPGARPGGAPYWADVHIAPVPIAPGEGAIDGSLQGSSSAPKVRSGPQS
jgi:hypothetical protein